MSPSVCLIIRSDNSLEFETPIPDWDRSATAQRLHKKVKAEGTDLLESRWNVRDLHEGKPEEAHPSPVPFRMVVAPSRRINPKRARIRRCPLLVLIDLTIFEVLLPKAPFVV